MTKLILMKKENCIHCNGTGKCTAQVGFRYKVKNCNHKCHYGSFKERLENAKGNELKKYKKAKIGSKIIEG